MAASKPGSVVGGDCPLVSPLNPNVDSSWVQYSGFGCDHALIVPGPTTPPVPPFEWGPCPASAGTTGECQQLLPRPGGKVAAFERSFARSATGGAVLGAFRYTPEEYGEFVIGEADGPILLAAVGVGHVFTTDLAWFDASSYAFTMRMTGEDSSEHGIIAGRLGEPAPTHVRRVPNAGQISSNWAVSGDLVVRSLHGITASRWLAEDGPLVYEPSKDPEGLSGYIGDVRGDRLFVRVNANGRSGVLTWTEADGLTPLIRYYGTYEKSAQRWFTDGQDMVWVDGEGKQTALYEHPTMTVMTAPYSTDAATIQQTKRSLGPQPVVGAASLPFPVGCGYAATAWLNAEQTAAGLAVVRLSDGVWWRLKPGIAAYAAHPLGLTCEHVYYSFAGQILRIRLDSLPPGGLP